jgi:thioredoxin reductase (NADPH)
MSIPDLSNDAAAPSELEFPYSSLEYRQHQMFPRLSAAEIRSLRRFARPMSFKAGELIFETGHVALGLFVLLHGRVRIYSRDSFGRSTLITEHEDGHFMAEMAQLSGKPALIDAVALTDVDTLVIEPDRLRALIVADAQLGEHIMRALILRRLGLIEQGLGPIIVGNGDDARVIALQGFLRRNAYPAMVIDARSDPDAVTLLGGMTTGPDDFPLVFCPNGHVLRAPDEASRARFDGLFRSRDSFCRCRPRPPSSIHAFGPAARGSAQARCRVPAARSWAASGGRATPATRARRTARLSDAAAVDSRGRAR